MLDQTGGGQARAPPSVSIGANSPAGGTAAAARPVLKKQHHKDRQEGTGKCHVAFHHHLADAGRVLMKSVGKQRVSRPVDQGTPVQPCPPPVAPALAA